MTFKGFFVDDKDRAYADLLSRDGELEIEFMEVEQLIPLAKNIAQRKPDVVALDYRLDEFAAIESNQTYKGSALAQQLRDEAIDDPQSDFALVIVSAEEKIKALYRPDWTAHDLFDRVYTKDRIIRDDEAVKDELFDLCTAYDTLRKCEGRYDLFDLSAIDPEDTSQIDFQELRERVASATAPHLVVRTFLKGLILRTGPLLDEAEVAARMGVAPDQVGPLVEALDAAGARYSGILGHAWPRWWAYKVDGWTESILGRRYSSFSAAARAKILSEHVGIQLKAARSPWNDSDEEKLSFACTCCRRPTEIRHSLSVFDAVLPRHLVPRRICWDCVQLGTCAGSSEPIEVADTDVAMVKEVQGMKRNVAEAGS